ncbi:ABC transporter ATP-binding protein [Halomonas beimenensis]|nr:ABC transporter ATP-binding protein [Halomonas beimenensis]
MATPEIVLDARGLTRTYLTGEVEVPALRGVDLALSRGELVVMLGASGSGKSTLLNILGGLDRADAGRLRYLDQDLSGATRRRLTDYRRRHVGFVFQFYNLISSLTARENVAIVADISEAPMAPEDALELVGLGHRLDHFPSQLSGGEQQRVAIARALAKRPALLFCDEPTGALDFRTGIRVLEVIERVNRDTDTTVAIITHNAVIGGMADRVLHLRDGRLEAQTRPEQRQAAGALVW